MSSQRSQSVRRSPRENARDAFRTSLREAAERVFVRSGYHAAKMTEIAAAAGVAVGTLYNYFESKEEIFAEIFAVRSRDLHARLEPALEIAAPLPRLERIVRTCFEYIDRHGALFALFVERGGTAEYDLKRLGGDVTEAEYVRFLRVLADTIGAAVAAGELRRDIPAATLVAALSGAMNGATYAWLKRRRRGRLSAVTADLLELFLSGARPST
jgi:AcrR family transcriptional regulator